MKLIQWFYFQFFIFSLSHAAFAGLVPLEQKSFPVKQFFELPSTLSLYYPDPAPPPTNKIPFTIPNSVFLVISNAGASDAQCTYTTHNTNPAPVTVYQFLNCTQGPLTLNISANDFVSADSFTLGMNPLPVNHFTQVNKVGLNFTTQEAACNSNLTNNTHLLGNLLCPNASGSVMTLKNTTPAPIFFDGHGFSVSASTASAGLYAMGYGLTIQNLTISGMNYGIGLSTYNTNQLLVQNCSFSKNSIGIQVYSDTLNSWGAIMVHNHLSQNQQFGLRFSGSTFANSPTISNNDFTNNLGYALSLYGDGIHLSDSDQNNYTGSMNGLYLGGGNINLTDLNLAPAALLNNPVYVTEADLTINHSNFTPAASSAEKQNQTGLSLYRVKSANISGLTINGAAVAVKIATDSGYQSQASINESTLTHNSVAGIEIQSYDSTLFGSIVIQNNHLQFNPPNFAIWSAPAANGAQTHFVSVNSNNSF